VVSAREALVDAADLLRAASVPEPELDAELLLRHVLGLDRAGLIAAPERALTEPERRRFSELVLARRERAPVQHLLGRAWFYGRELLCEPTALVPRPETELLVEAALARLADRASPLVADVGTGSGCIALAIAAERPDAEVHAVDLSGAALDLARRNAERLGAGERVSFHKGDLVAPLAGLDRGFDLIASNPPYVDRSEYAQLAPEVRDHEPRLALVPPSGDRFELYARLVREAGALLRPGGALALELGHGMAKRVGSLAGAAGLCVERVAPDLQGIERVLVASRP
jgi:release factor glutamine methyltransferase